MKPKAALDLLTDKLLAYGPSKKQIKKIGTKRKKIRAKQKPPK
jgi:hypothetical protein